MRIQTLILSLLFCITSAFAKDVITKNDGTKLDAKVEEITETVVKYRKVSNPNGPVYTIPVSSVASVLYENGDTDTFNVYKSTTDVAAAQTPTLSDEELMQLAESNINDYPSGYVSDADLLKMYYGEYESSAALIHKANKYRRIGWIGGGILFAAGLAVGIPVYVGEWYSWGITWMGVGTATAVVWCLGFNLKANSIMKQVRQIQTYSTTLVENEIMRFGNKSLTAGVNVMGNRMVNSHSLGLSLGLNF